MKRFLTGTAIVIALAVPTISSADLLADQIAVTLDSYGMPVDVSELSQEQKSALYLTITSDDSPADQQRAIEAIVNDNQFEMQTYMQEMGIDDTTIGANNNLRDAVVQDLTERGYEVDPTTLTDSQVSQLFLKLGSDEYTDRAQIDAILQ